MEESLAVLIEIKWMLSGLISSLFVDSRSGNQSKRPGGQSQQRSVPQQSGDGSRTDS